MQICANPKVQDVIEANLQTAYLIRDARKALKFVRVKKA